MSRRKVARKKRCLPQVTLPRAGYYLVSFRNGTSTVKMFPAGSVVRDVAFIAMVDPSVIEEVPNGR